MIGDLPQISQTPYTSDGPVLAQRRSCQQLRRARSSGDAEWNRLNSPRRLELKQVGGRGQCDGSSHQATRGYLADPDLEPTLICRYVCLGKGRTPSDPFDFVSNNQRRCSQSSRIFAFAPSSDPDSPHFTSMVRPVDEDPLTLALLPPPDETYEQRLVREAAEAEAKRISDEIDEQIRKEKEQLRRTKRPVKLLLLGQSESGKTATLKNFQLTYARKEWSEEKAAWRSVVFLNLVRNANEILAHLHSEMADLPYNPDDSQDDLLGPRPPRALPRIRFTEEHRQLRLRLAPLAIVQHTLESRLGSASQELFAASGLTVAAPFDELTAASGRRALQEFSINSSNGWKSALDKFRSSKKDTATRSDTSSSIVNTTNGTTTTTTKAEKEAEEDVAEVIASCREDIKALWDDDIVREMLNRRKIRLEDAPGFFITDADRIARRDYQPTDDDVIRARLRTLGVQEYRFIFDHGRTMGQEWRLYDVGGTRSSRGAWYPYFDDVDAIIFLAPISPFDEKLAEDRRVNRLEDSYLLWRSVCSCKLLARTQIILFLNKCDLLQAKLQRGVRIRDSVPSFGDRKNDLPTATRYFQQHFKEISRNCSPIQRPFYVHLTSVIDTRSTAVTLGAVEESILREHLRRADLM